MNIGKSKSNKEQKLIFENEFTRFIYSPESKEVLQTFSNKASQLTDEDFLKTGMSVMQSIPDQCPSARFFLIDTENFHFTIRPNLQKWVSENYAPKIDESGIEKVGVVFPIEFYTRLSAEQTAEESMRNSKIKHQIKFFETVETARAWFGNS